MVEQDWKAEARRQAMNRAPLLSEAHAADMADDLHRAWPEMTPAQAVGWFFAFMPQGWKGAESEALAA